MLRQYNEKYPFFRFYSLIESRHLKLVMLFMFSLHTNHRMIISTSFVAQLFIVYTLYMYVIFCNSIFHVIFTFNKSLYELYPIRRKKVSKREVILLWPIVVEKSSDCAVEWSLFLFSMAGGHFSYILIYNVFKFTPQDL